MAILFAIPFAVRILFHSEVGEWTNFLQASFHTHLELYLGNSCLGNTHVVTYFYAYAYTHNVGYR